MKRLFLIVSILSVTCSMWAGNTITYKASEKLIETTDNSSGRLHTKAFNVSIKEHTFSNGTGTITFSGDVTSIGSSAFVGCKSLTSITIPNSVTSIGGGAFNGCSALTSISIPNSVTSIGRSAFYGCTGLTSITIPSNVSSIGDYTFYGCTGLTSIAIPSNVSSIGVYAFSYCNNLSSMTVESANTVYDSRDNCNAIIRKSDNCLIFGCMNTIIPNSVVSIGPHAFYAYTRLSSILIPSSVTTIEQYAFASCDSLSVIVIDAATPPLIQSNTFYAVNKNIPIYVTANTANLYRTAPYWSEFTNIIDGSLNFSVSLNSSGNGTVIGSGMYAYDSLATFTAVPDEHCYFVKWSDGSTANPRTMRIQDNVLLTAEFSNKYELTLQSNNPTWGAVVGAGKYAYGSPVTFMANGANHYHFVDWNDGATDNPRQITLTSDTAFTANFAIDQHTIELLSDGNGFVNGGGTFAYNTTISLSAVANPHYHFAQWSDGNTDNPRSLQVTSDAIYTANFALDQHTVTVTADAHGSTTGSGAYPYNTPVTISAKSEDAHYHFVNWNDGSTQNPRVVTVTEDATYSANFALDQHSVTVGTNDHGVVTGDGVYDYNTSVTLTAIADEYYHFAQWSDGNKDNPRTIIVTSDTTITAEFSNQHTLTLQPNNPAWGTVTGAGTYTIGTQHTIEANAISGYHFTMWSDGNTDNPRTITIMGDSALTAFFSNRYTITVQSSDITMGRVTGSGEYIVNTQATITAIPAHGYHFVSWNDGNTNNPRLFSVDANQSFTATFAPNTYSLSIASANQQMGSVNGNNGTYDYLSQVTISATNNQGYYFVRWSDGCADNPRILTITADSTLTAEFDVYTAQSGHQYINLGLPSGTRWAACNVGATVPEDFGEYYAWGETVPNNNYVWSNYKFQTQGAQDGVCNKYSSTSDNALVLYPEDDAATYNWGEAWRMPTKAETKELFENCTYEEVLLNGVNGYKFVSKVNGKSIFLPEAGYKLGANYYSGETRYWCATRDADMKGYIIYGKDSIFSWNYYMNRFIGASVRPVFSAPSYTVTVTSTDTNRGSVSGGNTYFEEYTAVLTATPKIGYHFAQWSDGNTDNPRTIIVTSDTTLTATFAINSYTLTLSANNSAWGTVSGAGTYEYGTRVTMTATASEDRCFVQWSDGNTQNPRNIIMTQDTTIQAIFREYYLENGYEYVDLNLPSGLKWATCNVGATTPEGYGNDFMWGDTKWYTGNDFYTFSFYHYGGTYTSQGGRIYTKYNGTDNLTVLEPQDDAAVQNMGGYWHIPSRQDWMELYNECTWTWTTHNGINGYEVKSKTNNNSIFLPTIIGVYPYNTVNQTGLYWTSELSDSYVSDAYSVRFSSTSINCPSTSTRYYGLAVRAVCPPTIRISAYASDTTMGQVTGAGTYIENATVTLVAVPAFGYHFVGWSDGVTTATRTFSATTPVSLTADFAINQYTLTLGTNNPAGGTVSGGGTYTHGTQVTVEATANEGYQFVRWSDRSTLNPHRIVMTDTMTLIAEFQPLYTITLQTSNPAWGTVSDGGVYPANSTVTLTATPATGYYFVGWSDSVSTNPRVLTVLSDSTLTAEFDMIRKENGYQYIDMGLPSGTRWATCNVGASSPEGYGNYFMWGDPRPKYPGDNGFDHACNCGVNGRCVYTSSDKMTTLLPRHDAASTQMGGEWRMPTAAEWTELRNQCTWTWTQINGVKGYEVRSKVNNHCIFLPAAGYCDYSNNALQSPSMMGYTGRYWSSECSSSTYCAYYTYMSSAMVVENIYEQVYGDIYKASSVRAVCPPTQYKVTLLTQDANRGTVSGSGNYAENRTATITATAKTGYHFTAWSDGNTDNPRTITVTEDVTLTASFDPNQYLLTTLTDGNGTVTPGGTYDYLTTVDLYATPNAGYHFVRWSDGITQNPRRVIILRDCSYTAQFSNQYKLTVQSANTTMGSVSGGGQYTVNMPVTITATAADGYHFVQWSDGNKDNPRTVVVSGDATLTAQFAINQYSVLVEPNESLWGTVEGAGEYDHGSIVTLIAVPKPGYVFVDWSDGARYNPYVLYLTDELYMMANFTAKTGWDNVESGAAPEKIWINGSIYIRIGDALYDMLGNKFETTGR